MHAVLKSEFAWILGLGQASIAKKIKLGVIREALTPEGRIDIDHRSIDILAKKHEGAAVRLADVRAGATPQRRQNRRDASQARQEGRGRATKGERERQREHPTATKKKKPSPKVTEAASVVGEEEEIPIEQTADLTLRQIVQRYGTLRQFIDHLDALKKILDISAKELSLSERRGELISRKLVRTHVYGSIESARLRLLNDAAKTISLRVHSSVKGGGTPEESNAIVRQIISKNLKQVSATAKRTLKTRRGEWPASATPDLEPAKRKAPSA